MQTPSKKNLYYGKGQLLFRPEGQNGFLHFGNVPSLEITPEVEKTEKYESMSAEKTLYDSRVQQKKATTSFTLDEFSRDNVAMAFLGRVLKGTRPGQALEAKSVNVTPGQYVPLDVIDCRYTRLRIDAPEGTWTAGETVTQTQPAASGKIVTAEENVLCLVNVTGTFTRGASIATGEADDTATVAGVEIVRGAIVQASTGDTVYKAGADYHLIDKGGMLCILPGGAAASAETVKVTCDCPAREVETIQALSEKECRGELLFIGSTTPRMNLRAWKVDLKVSGGVGMINDDAGSIPMSGEFLSDSLNHPESPFFDVEYLDQQE